MALLPHLIGIVPHYAAAIWRKPDALCWKYETQPKRSPHSPINLLGKPQLIFTTPEGKEVLRIARTAHLPPSFAMIETGQIIGTIKLRTILRNRYTIQLYGGPVWTFHMPLSRVHFAGRSTEGKHAWVRIGSGKRQWFLLVEPEAENPHLLAALAFIHREWWCFA